MSVSAASVPAARLPIAPGPRYRTPFAFLRDIRTDILGFLEGVHGRYGDVVCARPGWLYSYLVCRPEHAKHVLVDNHKAYRKGVVFQNLRRVAGDGLILSEGELWKRQRRLIGPSFHRKRIAEMGPLVVGAIQDLLDRWEADHRDGEPFDVLPEMSKLALDAVCRAMFGTDILDRAVREQTETDDGGECYVGELEYDANDNRTLRRKGEATNGTDPDNTVRTLYDERDLVFEVVRGEGSADQSTTALGVRCADITRASKGISSWRRWERQDSSRGRSESDPIRRATFFMPAPPRASCP